MSFCPIVSLLKDWITLRVIFVSVLFLGTNLLTHGLTKVKPTTIIVSIEGEATIYNVKDDFEVTLNAKSVGKKIDSKSIIKTEKNGTLGLLFSNGTLLTIKPGSRFFLREYTQKIISADNLPDPSKLEEEPSQSTLLAHLDFGELVVKVPKLKKGSTMNLTSPLGTAGIRGTMFQMMAVRNEITGDIMGGVNLISGDIQFTNTNGVQTDLFSGQSIQLATSRLGETRVSETGGLVNLTKKFGPSLSEDVVPQPIEMIFPNITDTSEEDGSDTSESDGIVSFSQSQSSDWSSVHELASEIFFEIEESESNSESFTFSSLSTAQGTEVPNEVVGSVPTSSAVVSVSGSMASDFFQGIPPEISLKGDKIYEVEMLDRPFSEVDPWINASNFLKQDISKNAVLANPPDTRFPGTYELIYQVEDLRGFVSSVSRTVNVVITPPTISLFGGRNKVLQSDQQIVIPYLVQRRIPTYPVPDDGPFQLVEGNDPIYPGYLATDFNGRELNIYLEVLNEQAVDFTKLGQVTQLTLSVSDLPTRKIRTPQGKEVSTSISPFVEIVDNLPPLLSLNDGVTEQNPMRVEGVLNTFFVDPGINILDNYYTQEEIEQHLGLQSGAADSAFGFVDMEIAGIYRLDYQQIEDPSGNEAEILSRWVEVYDITPPEMTLYGADPYFVDVNASNVFNDPGAFAIDNLDRFIDWEGGNGRIKLSIEKLLSDDTTYEPVETTISAIMAEAKKQQSLHATFRLTYTVQDVVGNESSIQRQLVLINSPFPEPRMVMHGDNIMYHEVNTEFVDPGVTAYKELGSGLEPINLNEYMTINAFLVNDALGIKEPTVVDPSKVNYFGPPHHQDQPRFYVDSEGNRIAQDSTSWRRLILEYLVVDQFGNTNRMEREIRIQDTIAPVIVLNEGPQGVNFPDLQGGRPYVEPGATITDNYDGLVTLNSTLLRKLGVDSFEVVDDENLDVDGFTILGDYIMRYTATDSNENEITTDRLITVIDTIPPQVALVTHDFFDGTALATYNTDDFQDRSIVSEPKYPMPNEIQSVLTPIPSQFALDQNTSSIFALTLFGPSQNNQDFYILLQPEPSNIASLLGQAKVTKVQDPVTGRWLAHYSAFDIEDGSRRLTDPGVYARNDTELEIDFSHTIDIEYINEIDTEFTTTPKVGRVIVNYVIKQSSGEVVYINNARSLYILDIESPVFKINPQTSLAAESVIAVEAGTEFYDTFETPPSTNLNLNPTSQVRLYALSTSLPDYDQGIGFVDNYISVVDAREGDVTSDLERIISRGPLVSEGDSMPAESQFFPVGQIVGNPPNKSQMTNHFRTIADSPSAYNDTLNRMYRIKYIARDKRGDEFPQLGSNENSVVRYFIVKDTIRPRLELSTEFFTLRGGNTETIDLDYLPNNNAGKPLANGSTMNVDITNEASVKEYIAKLFNVIDFDPNFDYDDPDGFAKWNINIDDGSGGPFQGATKFPATALEYQDPNSGYDVTVSVTDDSGRVSDTYTVKLAVIDNTPPEIHLIGDAEIHDFYRYGPNSSLNNSELPFPDRPNSDDSNKIYDVGGSQISPLNSTGFQQGEHRMLLGEYNFLDPGVYAEDYNGDFNLNSGFFPDLDRDGVGETHGYKMIDQGSSVIPPAFADPGAADLSRYDAGIIYAWTDMIDTKSESLQLNSNAAQYDRETGVTPLLSAEIPDINGDNLDFNSSFSGIDYIPVTRKTYKIFYIIKDSWDNPVETAAYRVVHIYESQQFPGYAFYATPVVNGVELSSYYDVNGTSDNFMSSIRKDYDGDGVSDFWEVVLTDAGQNAHLDPSFIPSHGALPWNDPESLTTALATLTDGNNRNFNTLRERTKYLLDGKKVLGANNVTITNGFMYSNGAVYLPNTSVRGTDDNILNFDFNKAIP